MLVASVQKSDQHDDWSPEQFRTCPLPFLTAELYPAAANLMLDSDLYLYRTADKESLSLNISMRLATDDLMAASGAPTLVFVDR